MMIDHSVAGNPIQERPKLVAGETASGQMMPELLPDDLIDVLGVRSGRDASGQKRQQLPPMPSVEDLHRLMGRPHRLNRLGATGDECGQGFVAGACKIFGHDQECGRAPRDDQ